MGAVPASATAPATITWEGSIVEGATFVYGAVPAAPTCTAGDDTGVVPCVVTGYDTAVGSHVLTATATSTDATLGYTVEGWTLKGFFRPVKTGEDVWNRVKGGSKVPFKFKVFEGDAKAKSPSVVASFTTQQLSCTDGSAIGDPAPIPATGKGSVLKFRDGAFHQNWKTPKLAKPVKVKGTKPAKATACYQATLVTLDGSTLSALFRLT
jgi:hypothetical protein